MSRFPTVGVLYTVPAVSGQDNVSGIETCWFVTSLFVSGLTKAAGGDEEEEQEPVYSWGLE